MWKEYHLYAGSMMLPPPPAPTTNEMVDSYREPHGPWDWQVVINRPDFLVVIVPPQDVDETYGAEIRMFVRES